MIKVVEFVKKEIVLVVAVLLAVISCFFVPVSEEYISYIDFNVLVLLWSLMLVVAGLSELRVFDRLVQMLVNRVRSVRMLVIMLVMVTFVLAAWITNDVALITLVPFAILALNRADKNKYIIYTVVLQTVAANLGSAATPFGNPQNLFLFTASGMSLGEFVNIMFPYSAFSLVILTIACFFVKNEMITVSISGKNNKFSIKDKADLLIYILLFVICILSVLKIVDYRLMFAVVLICVLCQAPKLIFTADYSLLITFVAFFIFVGNVKQIEAVNAFLSGCVYGNEVAAGIISSQFISNVPAAVLLSGFTTNFKGLMIGTNIGGLGTVIASMASLISYKLYVRHEQGNAMRYMLVFTGVNIIFLTLLVIMAVVMAA